MTRQTLPLTLGFNHSEDRGGRGQALPAPVLARAA